MSVEDTIYARVKTAPSRPVNPAPITPPSSPVVHPFSHYRLLRLGGLPVTPEQSGVNSRRGFMALKIRFRTLAAGLVASGTALVGAHQLTAAFSDTRTISFFNIHTKETLTVTYKVKGRNVPEAMDKIDWILRDWRRNEKTRMDPQTIDILWEMHTELGSKEPINVISGFRSRTTNDMLRRTVGGQASKSQHTTGKAVDVTFPDVSLKQIRYSALIREQGGVGYYPTSGIPFVHVDTGRVRHWPRLPRYELALLFPNGKSQHHPADGGDITPSDVRIAQSQHANLATQIAGFFTLRQQPKPAIMVADASGNMNAKPQAPIAQASVAAIAKPPPAPAQVKLPEPRLASLSPQIAPQPRPPAAPITQSAAEAAPPPKLVAAPKLVERPSRFVPRPSEQDRSQLTTLVSFVAESAPKLLAEPREVTRRAPGPNATAPQLPVTSTQTGQLLAFAEPMTPRTRWTQVAALDPATFADPRAGSAVINDASPSGWSNGWVAAPAYDEEHPEELSYRPFPLAPLLTASPSINEPVLSAMTIPDVTKILTLIDKTWTVPEMQFLPGQQTAGIMWAQQFKGHPVQFVDASLAERSDAIPTNLIPRSVKTKPAE